MGTANNKQPSKEKHSVSIKQKKLATAGAMGFRVPTEFDNPDIKRRSVVEPMVQESRPSLDRLDSGFDSIFEHLDA